MISRQYSSNNNNNDSKNTYRNLNQSSLLTTFTTTTRDHPSHPINRQLVHDDHLLFYDVDQVDDDDDCYYH